MKDFKILKEIKPKVKVVVEVKKSALKAEIKDEIESQSIDHVSSSRERPSGTLDRVESVETAPAQSFRENERDKEERETRFYESTRPHESRMSYSQNTKEDLAGDLGVASARSSSVIEPLERNTLRGTSNRPILDSGISTQDRGYELKDENNSMKVKRRRDFS